MTESTVPLVAHVIFRLDVGGLENGLVNLINHMPSDRYRHAIVCIDRSTDFKKRIKRADVEVVDINKRPGRDPRAQLRLFSALRSLQPEILHTRNLAALDALLPAAFAGIRHRIHGEHGWDVNDLGGTNPKLKWLRRLYTPLVTRYVTVSRDLNRYLTEVVRIDARRIRQLYNGVDAVRFSPSADRAGVRAAYLPDAGDDEVVVGTVGRLQPVKGHATLIAAFAELLSDPAVPREKLKLAIVGDGALRDALVEQARDAGIADRCWFPGHLDDIPGAMRCLDVFVQPSLAEGVSNTILEAMATGLPIVATDVGGNPELVMPEQTGKLIPSDNPAAMSVALKAYVLDANLRRMHGTAARERVMSQFSTDKMIQRYLDLYDECRGHFE